MLTFSVANIASRLRAMPMVPITLAFICGIVLSSHFTAHWALWLVLSLLSMVVARGYRAVALAAVFAFGGFVFALNHRQLLPQNRELHLVVKVTEQSRDYGRYNTNAADVLLCNHRRCRAKVRITCDSTLVPRQGDVIALSGVVRPFTVSNDSYAQSMYRQGFSGRVTVRRSAVESYAPARRESLHSRAVERLMSLTEKSEGRDVALSVTLGARTLSASQTERNYSLGGASHLLAVSGLHVGLLFALLNLLLFPLIFLWRGNILRAIAATALVWLYVALCGWPTSAIRAAVMFSVLQLSYLSKSRHMAENSLCSTAFVMLAFDPYMLFELSFQLSFTAVVAILFVARPVTALIRCGGVAKGAVDMTAISTASVLATAPIVSHSFGVVSLLSIVTTPLALLSSQLIIVLNIASLLLPRSVAQITAQSAAWCGSVQNSIVENVVCLGFGYAQYRIGEMTETLCYVALALLVLLSFGFRWPRSER